MGKNWTQLIGILFMSFNSSQCLASEIGHLFNVHPGLKISKIATDQHVHDCTSIAIGNNQTIFVAGPNYLRRITLEPKTNAILDVAEVTDSTQQAAQGLCIDQGSLYYVGDGAVWRVPDAYSSQPQTPESIFTVPTGGEHRSHAIRKGKQGNWFLITGNDCDSLFAHQNSTKTMIPSPRAGAIWKISDDWTQFEVWAHGFRNAYDFDFAADGKIITFDSDGERDVSLPWYRPTRVFEVQQGQDAGWVSRSWKRSNIDPLMPEVLAEFGRGSPTGVKRSPNGRMPLALHNGTFVLDWTFGKVLFVSDQGDTHCIVKPMGTQGFPVTDIEVFDNDQIIVSTGGRGSEGALYLISSVEPGKTLRSPNSLTEGGQRPESDESKLTPLLRKVRDQTSLVIHPELARTAVDAMQRIGIRRDQFIDALSLLIESLGGLGPGNPKDARGKTQVAAVFDGYRGRIRPRISEELAAEASSFLLDSIGKHQLDQELLDQIIRTLAVLEPESQRALNVLIDEIDKVESPTAKLHRLIAVARIPAKRNDLQTERIAAAMLQIPRLIREQGMRVDRHWPIRLAELFEALQYRDSLLPSRLVASLDFGNPADLVWMERMDPENLERARQKLLSRPEIRNNSEIAMFIALGHDVVPRPVIRQWMETETTRPAAIIAITNDARPSDLPTLQQAAWSTDPLIRKRSRDALKRLDAMVPPRPGSDHLIIDWEVRSQTILELAGDSNLGLRTFKDLKCDVCHDGQKATGPNLSGIGKRFGPKDLLRSIYDPSDSIPDRYQQKQIAISDGRILSGIPIYNSVDGITLVNLEGETIRINHDQIMNSKNSPTSFMPEGLLDTLNNQQIADLISYLQTR